MRRGVRFRVRLAVAIGWDRCQIDATRAGSVCAGPESEASSATAANPATGGCLGSAPDTLAVYVRKSQQIKFNTLVKLIAALVALRLFREHCFG